MTRYICLPNGGCLTFSAETLSFSRWHPLYLAGARSPVSCCELSSTITLFHAKGIDHILSIENIGNRPYSLTFRSLAPSLPPSLTSSNHASIHCTTSPCLVLSYMSSCRILSPPLHPMAHLGHGASHAHALSFRSTGTRAT